MDGKCHDRFFSLSKVLDLKKPIQLALEGTILQSVKSGAHINLTGYHKAYTDDVYDRLNQCLDHMKGLVSRHYYNYIEIYLYYDLH